MTAKSRERLGRAAGIVEGLSVCAGEKSIDKLVMVQLLIEQVLLEEECEQKENPA